MKKISQCYLTCPECKEEYDMSLLSLKAKRQRRKNLYCPRCGYRVGKLQ